MESRKRSIFVHCKFYLCVGFNGVKRHCESQKPIAIKMKGQSSMDLANHSDCHLGFLDWVVDVADDVN